MQHRSLRQKTQVPRRAGRPAPAPRTGRRRLWDRLGGRAMGGMATGVALLAVGMIAALLGRAWPILRSKPLSELLLGTSWHPLKGAFGFWPFIVGTLWATALAMVIAVPLCTLCAIYLSEYAHPKMQRAAKPLIDLLAGIPSVVYGLWGVLTVVPLIREHVGPSPSSSR